MSSQEPAVAEQDHVSILSLPVELQLLIIANADDAILSLRQVNRRFAAIITSHERLLADVIFARTNCGKAAAEWGLSCDSYRNSRNWRNNANFYKKFWRIFGNKKIYSDCWTYNSSFPFLDMEAFDERLMRSPLALAYVFSKLDPVVEKDPKWYLASVREISKY